MAYHIKPMFESLGQKPRWVSSVSNKGNDDGFSLLEVVLAIGLSVAILGISFMSINSLTHILRMPALVVNDTLALDRLEAQLRSDAQVAVAVDVQGYQTGSQTLTYYSIDADHQWHRWTYRLHQGLELEHDNVIQQIDPDLTIFSARFIPADQLAAPSELSAPIYTSLPPPQRYRVALGPVEAVNGVVEVRIGRGKMTRLLHLATMLVPSNFGIESGPQWHAVLSRHSTTSRRFVFGQKSFYTISGSVMYSYDNWKTSTTWCTYDIHGGLRNGDAIAEMHVRDRSETATAIFAGCQKRLNKRELPSIVSRERHVE